MHACNPWYHHLRFYGRFVDDTLNVTTLDNDNRELFLNYLNAIHPSVIFTCENGGRSINFLKLTISFTDDNKFDFSIYRKPTATDLVINKQSNHPTKHKHAAFHVFMLLQNVLLLSQCLKPISIKNWI